MKRICPLCERISQDGNLWCQEQHCPAETSPVIMGYGDFLGDIQVIRLLYVIRTAAIYQAQRGDEQVLLKVAHNGCEEQLKREAVLLACLALYATHHERCSAAGESSANDPGMVRRYPSEHSWSYSRWCTKNRPR